MRKKILAIHSFRGGTGKTTIATYLAAIHAIKGFNVALLDLDFRAPSLFGVFSKGIQKPVKYWLNDFMLDECTLEKALIDISEEYHMKGKMLIGLANPDIGAIRNMIGRSRAWEVTAAKKLFAMQTTLSNDQHVDCCILDTSPGIQYSSINSVVCSDVVVIVTTLDPVDLEGARNMVVEFYDEFEKKSVIIINKVFPQTQWWSADKRNALITAIEASFDRPIIGLIPCYCDVLKANRDSLLIEKNPSHPFLRDLEEVVWKLEHM